MGSVWKKERKSITKQRRQMGPQNMNINRCLKLFNSTSVLFRKTALLPGTSDTHTLSHTHTHAHTQFHNRESTHVGSNPFASPHPRSSSHAISHHASAQCLSAQLPEMSATPGRIKKLAPLLPAPDWRGRRDPTWHPPDFLCCLWLTSPPDAALWGSMLSAVGGDCDVALGAQQGAAGCRAARGPERDMSC